jgi:hypothetical protein
MHLIRTECSKEADNMNVVRFLGQGGESVEVKLAGPADGSPVREEQIIAAAAATMVQLAAFQVEVDREDVGREEDGSQGGEAAAQ